MDMTPCTYSDKRKKRYILLLNLVMKGVMTLTEKFDEYKKRDRIDSDYSDYKEEYAAEVAPQRIDYDYDEKDHKDDVRSSAAGSTAGFIALALSILSLFTFPTLFGLVSVLLGIYAYNRGATVTGGIAAIVGGIAALIAILFRVALIGLLFSLFKKKKVSRLCGIPYPVNTSSDGYLIFVLLVALKKRQVLTVQLIRKT